MFWAKRTRRANNDKSCRRKSRAARQRTLQQVHIYSAAELFCAAVHCAPNTLHAMTLTARWRPENHGRITTTTASCRMWVMKKQMKNCVELLQVHARRMLAACCCNRLARTDNVRRAAASLVLLFKKRPTRGRLWITRGKLLRFAGRRQYRLRAIGAACIRMCRPGHWPAEALNLDKATDGRSIWRDGRTDGPSSWPRNGGGLLRPDGRDWKQWLEVGN